MWRKLKLTDVEWRVCSRLCVHDQVLSPDLLLLHSDCESIPVAADYGDSTLICIFRFISTTKLESTSPPPRRGKSPLRGTVKGLPILTPNVYNRVDLLPLMLSTVISVIGSGQIVGRIGRCTPHLSLCGTVRHSKVNDDSVLQTGHSCLLVPSSLRLVVDSYIPSMR